jgi:hypothetical protein
MLLWLVENAHHQTCLPAMQRFSRENESSGFQFGAYQPFIFAPSLMLAICAGLQRLVVRGYGADPDGPEKTWQPHFDIVEVVGLEGFQ